jgi:hypothetical protein
VTPCTHSGAQVGMTRSTKSANCVVTALNRIICSFSSTAIFIFRNYKAALVLNRGFVRSSSEERQCFATQR